MKKANTYLFSNETLKAITILLSVSVVGVFKPRSICPINEKFNIDAL